MKKSLAAIAILMSVSSYSWGVGEVLKLNTSGTEYCYGYKPKAFTPSRDVDMWLRIDGSYSATIYLDPGLTEEVAVLDVDSAMISSNKASFSAFSGDSYDHIAAIGTFSFDSSGYIKSLKASIVRRGVLNSCYSKATVTGKRIN